MFTAAMPYILRNLQSSQKVYKMLTAVIYTTTHGTTAKVANIIRKRIGPEKTVLIDLRECPDPDITEISRIIIGGSIHAGAIQPSVKKFCSRHLNELLKKEVGLFMCGMNRPNYAEQFENAFPSGLRSHAKSICYAGGEFLFEKMNLLQRMIVKKIAGIRESMSKIDRSEIDRFVSEMLA